MKNYSKYGKGWFRESERHALAAKGIKTKSSRLIPTISPLLPLGYAKKQKMSFWAKRIRKAKLMSYPYTSLVSDETTDLYKESNYTIIEKVTHADGTIWYDLRKKNRGGRDVLKEESLTKKQAEALQKKYDLFYKKQGERIEWSKDVLEYAKKDKKVEITGSNLVDYITKYEGGNMTFKEYFPFFSYLIKTGQVWHLQGMYGRTASRLIDDNFISKDGKINWKKIKKNGIDLDSSLY